MTKLIVTTAVVLLISSVAFGQGGYISMFGDPWGTDCNLPDVMPGLGTYYVVHQNTAGATACQFWAPAPWCLQAPYISDTPVFPVTIGNSQTGVSIGYGACLASPIHVLTINFFVQGLSPNCCCYFIYPHPESTSGDVEIVDCSNQLMPASAGWGYINADYLTCGCWVSDLTRATGPYGCINDPVPVEQATWGQVKALYGE